MRRIVVVVLLGGCFGGGTLEADASSSTDSAITADNLQPSRIGDLADANLADAELGDVVEDLADAGPTADAAMECECIDPLPPPFCAETPRNLAESIAWQCLEGECTPAIRFTWCDKGCADAACL